MSDQTSEEHIEFYSASVNAWYNSALEHDKSLLTLSAGGIGLLITLLTTVGLKSLFLLIIYSVSILSFLICLITVLKIFDKNRIHIVKLFKGEDDIENPDLEKLDRIAIWSFGIAVFFTAVIGITTAAQSYKEKAVGDAKTTYPSNPKLEKKSFNGVQQLKPATPKSPNTSQNTTPPATSPTSNNPSKGK